MGDLAKSYREGYIYTGQYSECRRRFFGASPCGRSASQFVVFMQNHDQVGNRLFGERLSALANFEKLKLAAGATLLSPYLPLIFMGEEYGEDRPFLYFVSHSDPALQVAVREGRKAEFKFFQWQGEPPDPNRADTFYKSKLQWEKRTTGRHRTLLRFYQRLIELRSRILSLKNLDWGGVSVMEHAPNTLLLRRGCGANEVAALLNFGGDADCLLTLPEGVWNKTLDSAASEWDGPGSNFPDTVITGRAVQLRSHSFVLLERT